MIPVDLAIPRRDLIASGFAAPDGQNPDDLVLTPQGERFLRSWLDKQAQS